MAVLTDISMVFRMLKLSSLPVVVMRNALDDFALVKRAVCYITESLACFAKSSYSCLSFSFYRYMALSLSESLPLIDSI